MICYTTRMAEEWLTVTEAAQLIGYHADTVRKLVRAGEIKARKFGPVWQVDRADLLAYVKQVKKLGEKRGPKIKD
jgi:excisionase family DNA binding protein